jgi:lipoprotein-anchoring transpeptidase ErfK/SrfK
VLRQGIALAIVGAALAMGGAAAWSIGIADRPSTSQQVQTQTPEPPAWPSSERVELSEAQLIQAKATGVIDREVKTLLNVQKRLSHGDFVWNDRKVPKGPVWVRVDLNSQLVSVFRAGHEIGTAVILYGAEEKQTPSGVFPVLWKAADHHSSLYDAPMPYTLRLTNDGVAIHGSDVRWGAATHGCIGVPLEFARRLFNEVRTGDEVLVVGGIPAPERA